VLQYLGEVTVAPITTTVRDIPSEVFHSKADGLPQECAVNCDHLQTVSKVKIGPLITSLPRSKMIEVGQAIRFALDLRIRQGLAKRLWGQIFIIDKFSRNKILPLYFYLFPKHFLEDG
jgi:mRNA interferase MazF